MTPGKCSLIMIRSGMEWKTEWKYRNVRRESVIDVLLRTFVSLSFSSQESERECVAKSNSIGEIAKHKCVVWIIGNMIDTCWHVPVRSNSKWMGYWFYWRYLLLLLSQIVDCVEFNSAKQHCCFFFIQCIFEEELLPFSAYILLFWLFLWHFFFAPTSYYRRITLNFY